MGRKSFSRCLGESPVVQHVLTLELKIQGMWGKLSWYQTWRKLRLKDDYLCTQVVMPHVRNLERNTSNFPAYFCRSRENPHFTILCGVVCAIMPTLLPLGVDNFSKGTNTQLFCFYRQQPLLKIKRSWTTGCFWEMSSLFSFCILLSCSTLWSSNCPTHSVFPLKRISGVIPESVGQLSNLTSLNFSNNQLRGGVTG